MRAEKEVRGTLKPKQRRSQILEAVGQQGEVSVEVLAQRFDVSVETIRRDLGQLAESGVLQKIHGGARRLRLHAEGSFDERMAENAEAKQIIAKKLAAIVEPGDTIFIDTGSTTLICAQALAAIDRLTVITNSVRVAQVLGKSEKNITVYLLGGTFSHDNAETVGPLVIDQIARFQVDHAVLTVAAINADVGAMDSDFDEAQVARAMIDHANHTIVLANVEKLGRNAAYRVCRLDEINSIVCDQSPGAEFTAALDRAKVELR